MWVEAVSNRGQSVRIPHQGLSFGVCVANECLFEALRLVRYERRSESALDSASQEPGAESLPQCSEGRTRCRHQVPSKYSSCHGPSLSLPGSIVLGTTLLLAGSARWGRYSIAEVGSAYFRLVPLSSGLSNPGCIPPLLCRVAIACSPLIPLPFHAQSESLLATLSSRNVSGEEALPWSAESA